MISNLLYEYPTKIIEYCWKTSIIRFLIKISLFIAFNYFNSNLLYIIIVNLISFIFLHFWFILYSPYHSKRYNPDYFTFQRLYHPKNHENSLFSFSVLFLLFIIFLIVSSSTSFSSMNDFISFVPIIICVFGLLLALYVSCEHNISFFIISLTAYCSFV